MRFITFLAGIILFLLGLVFMITPFIGSSLAMVVGLGLIIYSSDRAAKMIRDARLKYIHINRFLSWLEDKMGEKLSKVLRRTRPEEHSISVESDPSKK